MYIFLLVAFFLQVVVENVRNIKYVICHCSFKIDNVAIKISRGGCNDKSALRNEISTSCNDKGTSNNCKNTSRIRKVYHTTTKTYPVYQRYITQRQEHNYPV